MQGLEWLTGEVWVALVSLLAAAATVGFLLWSNRRSEQQAMREFDLARAMDYNDDFLNLQAAQDDSSSAGGKGELGGKTDRYEWTQTESDVEIRIPLQEGTSKDAIKCKITSRGLDLSIRSAEAIQGEWFEPIAADESAWQFETSDGKRYLLINLAKKNASNYWRAAIRGDPEINPPPNPAGRMRMNAAQAAQMRRQADM